MPSFAMRCAATGSFHADATVAENIRRATLEKMQHNKLTAMKNTLDELHDRPLVDRDELATLSTTCGPMLNVDNWSTARVDEHESRFFMPCDWAQDWLEYEAWVDPARWIPMDDMNLYSSGNLYYPELKSDWFQESLGKLQDLCPNVWDDYSQAIARDIGLHLPRRQFVRLSRLGGPVCYHESEGMLAYLANPETDRPHAQCLIIDSADNVSDKILLRSEIETAITMCQHQLRDGFFVNHHTKPILITTVMRKQTARLIQAYFDGKQNKLVLRQSRLLDLSGKRPGADAWILLRWMASMPVGLTKYPDAAENGDVQGDDKSTLAPSITVSDSS